MLFLVLVLFISCDYEVKKLQDDNWTGDNISDGLRCQTDSDCVAATCCHPVECVSSEYKPDCSGISCSMECAPDTMDCGQGGCMCIEGRCKTEFY